MNNVLKIKDSSGNWIGIPAIRGEKGDKGENGANGKSAYETACEGGFTGTEAEFANLLSNPGMGGGAPTESDTFPWAFGGTDGVTYASDTATYNTIPLADGKLLVQCCTPKITADGDKLSMITTELPFTPANCSSFIPFTCRGELFYLTLNWDGNVYSGNMLIVKPTPNTVDNFIQVRMASAVSYIPQLQFSYVAVPPTSEVN